MNAPSPLGADSHVASTAYSVEAIRTFAQIINERKAELEAGRRDWVIAAATPRMGVRFEALQELCSQDAAAASAEFYKSKRGGIDDIARNLRSRSVELYDPIVGKRLVGGRSITHRKYQFLFLWNGHEPIIVAYVGSRPVILYYLARKVAVDIGVHHEDQHGVLSVFINLAKSYGRDLHRYLARRDSQKTACIIGDERPTHFIVESLGALQGLEDAGRHEAFWKSVDYLVVPADYAFLPPEELFDIPPTVRVIYTPLGGLDRLAFDRNLFVQRLMRCGHRMSEALRTRIIDYADSRSRALDWPGMPKVLNDAERVKVWFAVEVEKGRIQNQGEVFQELLAFLTDRYGEKFRLIVDGWSPMPLTVTGKDRKAANQIRSFLKEEIARSGVKVDTVEAFVLPYRDKLRVCAEVDFFVTMQGGAAIVPSLLRHKPGVTYHNPWGMNSETEVWTERLYKVPTDEPYKPGVHNGRDPFEVDIPAFRRQLEELVEAENIPGPSSGCGR